MIHAAVANVASCTPIPQTPSRRKRTHSNMSAHGSPSHIGLVVRHWNSLYAPSPSRFVHSSPPSALSARAARSAAGIRTRPLAKLVHVAPGVDTSTGSSESLFDRLPSVALVRSPSVTSVDSDHSVAAPDSPSLHGPSRRTKRPKSVSTTLEHRLVSGASPATASVDSRSHVRRIGSRRNSGAGPIKLKVDSDGIRRSCSGRVIKPPVKDR